MNANERDTLSQAAEKVLAHLDLGLEVRKFVLERPETHGLLVRLRQIGNDFHRSAGPKSFFRSLLERVA